MGEELPLIPRVESPQRLRRKPSIGEAREAAELVNHKRYEENWDSAMLYTVAAAFQLAARRVYKSGR